MIISVLFFVPPAQLHHCHLPPVPKQARSIAIGDRTPPEMHHRASLNFCLCAICVLRGGSLIGGTALLSPTIPVELLRQFFRFVQDEPREHAIPSKTLNCPVLQPHTGGTMVILI